MGPTNKFRVGDRVRAPGIRDGVGIVRGVVRAQHADAAGCLIDKWSWVYSVDFGGRPELHREQALRLAETEGR